MSTAMHLSHLIFTSSLKDDAKISFGLGLNLIYGPSNTGKSSIFDAIDFMFGRTSPLKELPEHEGYESILLGLTFSDGQSCTLVRSLSGGDIKRLDGLHETMPDSGEFEILKPKNKTTKLRALPDYIFGLLGLENKALKRNNKNQKERLTLRNFLPLFFVNETDIQRESSPYISVQFIKQTVERSRLKLVLTGTDDSALIPEEQEKQTYSRQARIQLLSELIEEQESKIAYEIPDTDTLEALEDQRTKLEDTLSAEVNELQSTESEYRQHVANRNRLREELNSRELRLVEIKEMLGRFKLLNEQYKTDTKRLENISESGTLIGALPLAATCPICGANTEGDRAHDHCAANIDEVVAAAGGELRKISVLGSELNGVIEKLRSEAENLQSNMPPAREALSASEAQIQLISPLVGQKRSQYSEVLTKKSEVEKSLSLFADLQSLQERQKEFEAEAPAQDSEETPDTQLPTHALFELSKIVSSFLQKWGIANSAQVHFDKESNDFVIGGKLRTSNGKGIRAITHAAATLALVRFTEEKDLPFPGLALLDSPLLAYEEPEDADDDLSGTDVNLRFFREMQAWDTRQTIVFENKRSIPAEFQEGEQVTHFTKSLEMGRYGFFPREGTRAGQ